MKLERGEQKKIAEKLGKKPSYLNDILKGRRFCSPEMAALISAESQGRITIMELLYPSGLPDGARLTARYESPCSCTMNS